MFIDDLNTLTRLYSRVDVLYTC